MTLAAILIVEEPLDLGLERIERETLAGDVDKDFLQRAPERQARVAQP